MPVNSPNPRPRPLTPGQIRAARALLRWSAEDLASQCALGIATVRRAEMAEHVTAMTAANNAAVRRAFEEAGVVFIDENGGGPGVRLRGGAPTGAAPKAEAPRGPEPRAEAEKSDTPKAGSASRRPPPVRSRTRRP